MANLQDIANLTGVSIGAVSRILNNDKSFNVSKETKENVLQAAKKLDYTKIKKTNKIPNISKREEISIGIIQMYSYQTLIEDPYYFRIENTIEALKINHSIKTIKIFNNHDGTFSISDNTAIQGIFAIGIFSEIEIENIKKLSNNIIFIDSSPSLFDFTSVSPDFQSGVELALKYFLERGHSKIGFIGENYILGNEENLAIEPRKIFFESFMKPRNLYNENYIIEAKTNVGSGYEKTKYFLEHSKDIPTAFFVSSDSVASGVIRAVVEFGLRIPEDISIIAFNNTVLSEYAMIPLTSIAPDIERMINIAMKNLINLILDDNEPCKTLIPCYLIERESVSFQ